MNHDMNNITNINEYRENTVPDASAFYINEPDAPVEFVSQELIDYYNQATANSTPDLWGRIEAGFELETKDLKAKQRRKVATTKKIVGFVAAAAIITIIAVPVMKLGIGGSKSESEKIKTEATHEMYYDEVSDSAALEAPSEDGVESVDEGVQESVEESATEYHVENDMQGAVTNDSSASGAETLKQLEEIQGIQTDARQIVVEGEFLFDGNSNKVSFKIKSISDNQYEEYVVNVGDEISLSNSMFVLTMDVMLIEGKITLDSVEIDDLGNITGRIIDLEHQGVTIEKESISK